MDQPLITVLVGAEGGASGQGASAQLIYKQLSKALSSVSSQKPLEISVALQKDLKQDLQAQLGKIKGLTVDVAANIKATTGVISSSSVKSQGAGNQINSSRDMSTASIAGAIDQNKKLSSSINSVRSAAVKAAEAIAAYNAVAKTQEKAQQSVEKSTSAAAAEQAKANKTIIEAQTQAAKFNTYLRKLRPSVVTDNAGDIDQIQNLFRAAQSGGDGAYESLRTANSLVKLFKANLKDAGKDGGTAFDHLTDKFQTFSTYLVSSAASLALVGSLSKAISVTYDLNSAMTDLQIVTGDTKQQAAGLVQMYNDMAQTLGTTTKNVSDAAVEWMRQGYTMSDTNKLIQDSMVLSIVGFMDSDAAAQALTSTMKGYQLSVEDAMGAVDKFTAVDMAAATSAGDIATALSKTAANAHLAGLSLDEVVGQLALVNETMQEAPETTGTFYNTMLSRLGMIKAGRLEDPETGESLSDVETVLNNLGISLRDSVDQFRDFGDVLNQVGSSWESYSSVQQRAIATAFAGTRQQTRFIALMEGWSKAAEYSEIAANSSGTAMEKFGIYQDSLAAKTNKLTASFENLTSVLVNDDLLGWFLDAGSAILNLAADIGSLGGGSVATITELAASVLLLATAFKTVANSKVAQNFTDILSSIKSVIQSAQLMGIVTSQGTTSFVQFASALKNMNEAQLVNIATINNQTLGTRALTQEELENALTQAGVEAATAKSTAAKVANTAATKSQTVTSAGQAAANTAEAATARDAATATNTLTASIAGLGAAMKALLFANPLTALITVVTLIGGAVAAFDALTVSVEEQAEKTRELSQEYSSLSTEITSLNGELETTRKRIGELKSQGTLTITEKDELNELQKQNDELERQLRIKEDLAQQKANELAESVEEEYNKSSYTLDRGQPYVAVNMWSDIPRGAQIDSGNAEEAIDFYIDQLNRIESAQRNLDAAFDNQEIDSSQYEKFAEELSDDRGQIEEDLAALVTSVSGWYDNLENATSKNAQSMRSRLDEILDAYDEYKNVDLGSSEAFQSVWDSDQFAAARSELLRLASAGQLTADTLKEDQFTPFINAMSKAGAIGGDTGVTFENLAAQITKMSESTAEDPDKFIQVGNDITTLEDALVGLINSYDMVNSVAEELNDTGTISANTLSNILEKFGEGASVDLTENVSQYIMGLKSASELLNDLQNAYKVDEDNFVAAMRAKLYAMPEFYNSLNANQKKLVDDLGASYGVDLSNFKTVEEKKLAIQAAIIQKMMGNLSKYTGMSYQALKANQAYLGVQLASQSIQSSQLASGLMSGLNSQIAGKLKVDISKLQSANQNYKSQLQSEYDKLSSALAEIDKVNQQIDNAIGQIDFNPATFSPSSSSSSNKGGSSAAKEVELYQVEIDELRKSLKALEDITNEINQKEIRLDLIDDDDIEGKQKAMLELLGLYTEQMKAIENLNIDRINKIIGIVNQLRAVGFDVTYDWATHDLWIENLEHLNELGVGLSTEDRNTMIKYYEELINKAEEYNQANIDGAMDYLEVQQTIKDTQEEFLNLLKDQLNETKDNLDSVLDLVKDMIKQEAEDMIDALEDQSDAYAKIIELKKKSLKLAERERSYQDGIKDRTKEIADLQARIDSLSMDDSREAQLEKQKLLEELAKLQEDLNDYQHDHSIESQQDALDEDLENFQDQIDDKIDEIQDFLDEEGRLTQEALDRIDQQGEALFDDLLDYALKYTDTTRAELEKMWADAMEAAKKYGSFVGALEGVTGEIEGVENGEILPGSSAWNSILEQMKELGSQWGSASPEEQKIIAEKSLQLGTMIGATRDQNGVWWYNGEKLFGGKYDTTIGNGGSGSSNGKPQPGSAEFKSVVARMRQLGSMWGSASPERQKEIADESLKLGTSIGATRDQNGVWWYNGKRLFDVYHSGGTAGGATPKSNEIFSLLERGEVIMNDKQQNALLPLLEGAVSVREAIGKLLSFGNFISGKTGSATQTITINDNTIVQVSDKEEFKKYLAENRREVANLIAREFA